MSPQAHREFWSVVTRPREQNGLGRSPNDAEELINVLEIVFEFWDDMPGIASTWRNIVLSLEIKGVQVHDANHAATAIAHGATHVLTLDLKDFDRYRKFGITPLLPDGL
jgi:predicted nucleic acid-binding protein